MWTNIVVPNRAQMTIWRMRILHWIPKATDTHWECVILTAFPPQQRLHERASLFRDTYSASIVLLWLVHSFPFPSLVLCMLFYFLYSLWLLLLLFLLSYVPMSFLFCLFQAACTFLFTTFVWKMNDVIRYNQKSSPIFKRLCSSAGLLKSVTKRNAELRNTIRATSCPYVYAQQTLLIRVITKLTVSQLLMQFSFWTTEFTTVLAKPKMTRASYRRLH
jgi:hypothetical protein